LKEEPIAKIRHVAIFAKAKLVEFYKTSFGLHDVFRHSIKDGSEAISRSQPFMGAQALL
jgi:hypothetical protein